jgi:putative oxidoreductase
MEGDGSVIDSRTAPYAALLLRVALGLLFITHGLAKVLGFGIAGTVTFFASIGYPDFVAYLVLLAELAGGVALVIGLWTRWMALALFVEMIGVIIYHAPKGWVFSAPGGGWEYPALWAVALVALYLLGDGPYAVTTWLKRWRA